MAVVPSWRLAARFVGLLAAVGAMHAANGGEPPAPGRWIVASVAGTAPITALDDAQAAALVGQSVVFATDSISFEQATCKQPRVTRGHRSPARFFHDFRIAAPPHWRKPVDWWEVRCAGTDTMGPFLVHGKAMLFVWYGVLLQAQVVSGGDAPDGLAK